MRPRSGSVVALLLSVLVACSTSGPAREDGGTPGASPDGSTPGAEGGCATATGPRCCVGGCGGSSVVDSTCTNGAWTCPGGSVLDTSCASAGGAVCTGIPPDPQRTYEYPGCANEDDGCPRLKTIACALKTLQREHGACVTAEDCVRATVDGRCTGMGNCPPLFVHTAQRETFEAAAAAEIGRYCPERGGCTAAGSCDGALDAFTAACVSGRCEAARVDGGSP
jgi:hypothetical protein